MLHQENVDDKISTTILYVTALLKKYLQVARNGSESFELFMKTIMTKFTPSRNLSVHSQQFKHQNNVRNLFKVINKDIKPTSLRSFCCLYFLLQTNFTHCSGVSTVNFEEVNVIYNVTKTVYP